MTLFLSQEVGAALQSAMLNPSSRLAALTVARPFLLRMLAQLLELQEPSPQLALTFMTAMQLAPHTDVLVLRYFRTAPPPFAYLLSEDSKAPPALVDEELAVQLAHATLYGMQHSEPLRQLWRWPSVALSLLQHTLSDVRWCAVQCTAVAFGMRDTNRNRLMSVIMSSEEVVQCALQWENTRAAIAAERATMFAASAPDAGRPVASYSLVGVGTSSSRKRKFEDVGGERAIAAVPGYEEVCGIQLPRRVATEPAAQQQAAVGIHDALALVHTIMIDRHLEAFVLGLCMDSPILLEGPPGCGKTAIVEHVAAVTGNSAEMIRIHVDDQMDSKSLLGAYIAVKPGDFMWQPGPLTQAVVQGRWILIEGINLAPAEVLAALLPLLDRRELHIPSRAEMLHAAPGFQLIATVTSLPGWLSQMMYHRDRHK